MKIFGKIFNGHIVLNNEGTDYSILGNRILKGTDGTACELIGTHIYKNGLYTGFYVEGGKIIGPDNQPLPFE
jgi:hypothetical protein